jgi:hypothetical protein
METLYEMYMVLIQRAWAREKTIPVLLPLLHLVRTLFEQSRGRLHSSVSLSPSTCTITGEEKEHRKKITDVCDVHDHNLTFGSPALRPSVLRPGLEAIVNAIVDYSTRFNTMLRAECLRTIRFLGQQRHLTGLLLEIILRRIILKNIEPTQLSREIRQKEQPSSPSHASSSSSSSSSYVRTQGHNPIKMHDELEHDAIDRLFSLGLGLSFVQEILMYLRHYHAQMTQGTVSNADNDDKNSGSDIHESSGPRDNAAMRMILKEELVPCLKVLVNHEDATHISGPALRCLTYIDALLSFEAGGRAASQAPHPVALPAISTFMSIYGNMYDLVRVGVSYFLACLCDLAEQWYLVWYSSCVHIPIFYDQHPH